MGVGEGREQAAAVRLGMNTTQAYHVGMAAAYVIIHDTYAKHMCPSRMHAPEQ